LSTVVLPLPRKPVSRVAGINDAGSVELIPDRPLVHPGRVRRGNLAAEAPDKATLGKVLREIGAFAGAVSFRLFPWLWGEHTFV